MTVVNTIFTEPLFRKLKYVLKKKIHFRNIHLFQVGVEQKYDPWRKFYLCEGMMSERGVYQFDLYTEFSLNHFTSVEWTLFYFIPFSLLSHQLFGYQETKYNSVDLPCPALNIHHKMLSV